MIPVNMFNMPDRSYQIAIRACDYPAAFCKNFNRVQSTLYNNFIVSAFNAMGNCIVRDGFVFWLVWDSYSAAKIHKLNLNPGFSMNFNRQLKHPPCGLHKIFFMQLI